MIPTTTEATTVDEAATWLQGGYGQKLIDEADRFFKQGYRQQQVSAKVREHCRKQYPHLAELIERIADQCDYQRRKYGNTTFTWPRHPEIRLSCDGWKGTRYPSAVLFVDIVTELSWS